MKSLVLFHFGVRAVSGYWFLIVGVGFCLIQEWPTCGGRGGQVRHDSPDGRSLAVVVPCTGRGLRGRVLSLVSVYGPVSGSGVDDERKDTV